MELEYGRVGIYLCLPPLPDAELVDFAANFDGKSPDSFDETEDQLIRLSPGRNLIGKCSRNGNIDCTVEFLHIIELTPGNIWRSENRKVGYF